MRSGCLSFLLPVDVVILRRFQVRGLCQKSPDAAWETAVVLQNECSGQLQVRLITLKKCVVSSGWLMMVSRLLCALNTV